MASSYTSPLTVVRDVETSILDAAVLEFLHVGKTKKMEKEWEDSGRGVSRGIEQITKSVNTRKRGRGERWTGK